jgi:hypothetical protein
MKELAAEAYQIKVFKLKNLEGISDLQIETHLELYAGYVRNTNHLNEQLAALVQEGKAGTPAYSCRGTSGASRHGAEISSTWRRCGA